MVSKELFVCPANLGRTQALQSNRTQERDQTPSQLSVPCERSRRYRQTRGALQPTVEVLRYGDLVRRQINAAVALGEEVVERALRITLLSGNRDITAASPARYGVTAKVDANPPPVGGELDDAPGSTISCHGCSEHERLTAGGYRTAGGSSWPARSASCATHSSNAWRGTRIERPSRIDGIFRCAMSS
jgi:hypothetical protein